MRVVNIILMLDPIEQFEAITRTCFFHFTTLVWVLLASFLTLAVVFYNGGRINLAGYVVESSYKFIYSAAGTILGQKHVGAYVYTYFFLFTFLVVNNIVGLTPWTFTLTSYFVVPLFFSFLSVTGAVATGWEIRGYKFFNILNPGSVPKQIFHFLIIIEFISYVMRIFSLAIRLFANMVAGHALVKILTGFTYKLATYAGWSAIFGALAACLIIAILMLEILIAGLQAYVFVFLSLIYLAEVLD